MGFFAAVEDRLQGTRGAQGGQGRMLLHSALKESLGMQPTASVLTYRNHRALLNAINNAYQCLGDIVGTRADLWAMSPERTQTDLTAALRAAEKRWPKTPAPQAVSRPGMRHMLGQGKPRAAVAAEAAYLAHLRGTGFASVIAGVVRPDLTDLDFIEALEAAVVAVGTPEVTDVDWATARQFTKVAGLWFSDPEALRVAQFCFVVFPEWRDVSDLALLARFAELVGELGTR